MADEKAKPTIDVQNMLETKFGAKLVGMGSEQGNIKIAYDEGFSGGDPTQPEEVQRGLPGTIPNGKTVETEINFNEFIKSQFQTDPSNLNFEYSSPEKPIDESPLSFSQRMKFEVAEKPGDKARLLAKDYGKENVRYDAKNERFLLKDPEDNQWKDASNTGFAGFLGKEGPVIAGSIAGAKAGSAVGSLAGPVGTAVGGLFGGGVGAVVGKIASFEDAKKMGIRTEEDIQEISGELGKEFILGLGGEAVGLGLRGGVAGFKAVNRAVKSAASKMSGDGTKQVAAEMLSKMTRVPEVDNLTWFEFPDEVAKHQQRTIQAFNASKGRGIDPLQREMADMTQNAIETAKQTMYKDYEKTFEPLKAITSQVDVELQPVFQDMVSVYKDFGLIDESGKLIKGSIADLEDKAVQEIITPKSVNALKKVHKVVSNAFNNNKGKLSFDDAVKLRQNLDEILEVSGAYKNQGAGDISSKAIRTIKGIRSEIDRQARNGLEARNPEARKLFDRMQTKYARRRAWLDDIAPEVRDARIDRTMKMLLNESGQRSRENAINLLKDTGIDAEKFMNDLYTRRAALATRTMFAKDQTGIGSVVTGAIRTSSPRKTTPMVARGFNSIQKVAMATDWINRLPKAMRQQLLENPDALRAVGQITIQSIDLEDKLPEMLLQKGMQNGQQQ